MSDVAHITQKQFDLERQFEELKVHIAEEHEKTKRELKDDLKKMDDRITARLDKLYELLARKR